MQKSQQTGQAIAVAMMKIYELEFEVLDNPSYSPDLALSDFFLFPKLNVALRVRVFRRTRRPSHFADNDANGGRIVLLPNEIM